MLSFCPSPVQRLSAALAFTLLAGSFGIPTPANATVVIPMADDALTEQAEAIVVGRVTELESHWDSSAGQIFTHITLSVDEVLKGDLSEGSLTLKQPGGSVGDLYSWVDGSPEFTRGEKVLVFLSVDPEGAFRVAQLYQGKFSVFNDRETGKEFAYRETHPHGVDVLKPFGAPESDPPAANAFHELGTMRNRIRTFLSRTRQDRQSQRTGRSVLPVPVTVVSESHENFTYMSPASRWFQPDTATAVAMQMNSQGEPLAPGSGFDQIRAAFQAWGDPTITSFRYQDGGFTSAFGFQFDGTNAISFRDPLNQIDPPSGCSGVLAIGGFYRSGSETRTVNGQSFYKILEGDIVFSDGWQGCNFYESFNNMAEVATHELGHVLGLNHSADSTATMAAFAHFDGRGASLKNDDKAGLAAIYPITTGGGGGGGGTCTYTIRPVRRTHVASGGTANVTVSATTGCTWSAVSNVSWVTVTAGASGSGNGTVTYVVAANTATSSRTGTLTIAGKTFTVTQRGRRR